LITVNLKRCSLLLLCLPLVSLAEVNGQQIIESDGVFRSRQVIKSEQVSKREQIPHEQQSFRSAIWIESEGKNRPFDTQASFLEYLKFLDSLELTDIYIQVYRNGRSWFPSMLSDDSPWRRANDQRFDPIGDTITFARMKGIRVHAWINTLRVYDNLDAPVFKILGEDAILIDNYGASLKDYKKNGNHPQSGMPYKLGTKGFWLESSNPALPNYMKELVRDLFVKYPNLDGLHLDMVRQPLAMKSKKYRKAKYKKLDFGYDANTLQRFADFSGLSDMPNFKLEAWKSWRRKTVTDLVSSIQDSLRSLSPSAEFSAAVIADGDKARDHVFQNWHEWLSTGVIDHAVPMAYTAKPKQFQKFLASIPADIDKSKVTVGIGAWLLKAKTTQFAKQMKIITKEDFAGSALFSYSNLQGRGSKKLLDSFQSLAAEKKKSFLRAQTGGGLIEKKSPELGPKPKIIVIQ